MDFNNVYVKYAWLDVPMHFIGGIVISYSFYLFLVLVQKKDYIKIKNKKILFIFIISFVALTTIIWETYEFTFDLVDNGTRQTNLNDTMTDILLGLLGGIIGFLFVK